MPRRPAPYKYRPKPTHKLTKAQAGEYGEIVQSHLEGDGDWAPRTIAAVTAEANRRLGISQGKKSDEYRSTCPKNEARWSLSQMDRRFDSFGRLAS